MKNNSGRGLELLSPAANLAVACAAIDAGADSVYMGGPAFGARSRAGNSMLDIEKAVRYAHRYAARCFLALNTLIYEQEMAEALNIARRAYEMGVDALIIQDMGLLEAGMPPIELHASTQCHIVTPEKARFLAQAGFKRIVLGRELSVAEIARIVDSTDAEIETFVHGALCVSYSGQCYMSCAMNGRSGNRGECAQSCRLAYRLENGKGEILQKDRYLLSMKDLNADSVLEDLIGAGVSCLKIEGRLKDATYVKNVTSYYRKRIDAILSGRQDIRQTSHGKVYTEVAPDLEKTYHREYTTFHLTGKREDWAVFGTPKATGENVGRIVAVEKFSPRKYSGLCLRVRATAETVFASGDGLCYYAQNGCLCGGSLERAERSGKEWLLFMQGPDQRSELPEPNVALYRNQHILFEKSWQAARVVRKIPVELDVDTGALRVTMSDGYGHAVHADIPESSVQEAREAGSFGEIVRKQLSRLGRTAYEAVRVSCKGKRALFVPVSVWNECRRNLVEAMDALREEVYRPDPCPRRESDTFVPYPGSEEGKLPYTANVANSWAEKFYHRHGIRTVAPAFERMKPEERMQPGNLLMLCKHCIRYQLGQCLKKDTVDPAYRGDLYLCYGRYKFALHFDCEHCRMEVRSCS